MRLLTSLLFAVLPVTLCAQDKPAAAPAAPETVPGKPPVPPKTAADTKPAPNLEELEQKFSATLANCTFTGRWCLIENGSLTPDKEDKYSISSAVKGKDGAWTINARIQYGAIDVTIPVPVKVEWAAGAPVIVVDNLGIPGGGKYSARVIIHNDSYAGVWSGGRHRGLLNGMITRDEKKPEGESKPGETSPPAEKKPAP